MNEDRRLTELQNNLQAMQKDGMDENYLGNDEKSNG